MKKQDKLADEIMNLTAENEVLKRDVQNLERTLEECNEELEDLRANEDILLTAIENTHRKIVEYEAGKAVILTADEYNKLCKIELIGVIEAYHVREEARKETAKEILKIVNDIGGCDATKEWDKGFDAAIDTVYKAIFEKYGVEVEE